MCLVRLSDLIKVLLVLNLSLRADQSGLNYNFPETLWLHWGPSRAFFLVFSLTTRQISFDRSGRGRWVSA